MHLIAKDWKKANLSERHQALCHFAEKVSEDPKQMKFEDLSSLKQTGYSDRAIHDAVQIIGYFNYINRIADSLGVKLRPLLISGNYRLLIDLNLNTTLRR